MLINLEPKGAKNRTQYRCNVCKKVFKARNSLWYHEQKCKAVGTNQDDLILELLKQNAELMEQNKELIKIVKNDIEKVNTTFDNLGNVFK